MQTIRKQIIDLLKDGEYTTRDLSKKLGIREREIYAHLPHVAKTVISQKMKLKMSDCICLSCGYNFENRKRFTRPGRCPKCKDQRINSPKFSVC